MSTYLRAFLTERQREKERILRALTRLMHAEELSKLYEIECSLLSMCEVAGQVAL